MIKGKHWPIDKKRIGDGFGLSLKNSKKLLNVAIEQFDKDPPDYALSIFLAASAIEEMGKGILLMSFMIKNQNIDSKTWKKTFEGHGTKITAAIDDIRKYVKEGDKENHEALNKLHAELLMILDQKFASIYVDWDAVKNDWAFFDERSQHEKKKLSHRILTHAKWLIENYTLHGKFITEREAVVIEMVKQGMAVGECKACDFKSNDFKEIKKHTKQSTHQIGFREV